MGNPYTSVSISGYNSNPPPDDGSQTAANEIKWSNHKLKIGDPLKTAIEAMNTNVLAAFAKQFGNGISAISTNYTVLSADQGKILVASNGITVTLPGAASVGSNFTVAIRNAGATNVTVDGNASETINGSTSLTLIPGGAAILSSDGSNFYALIMSNTAAPDPQKGHIFGLTLSNNGTDADHDIDIAAGEATSDASTPVTITLASGITKRIDASWAVGTNQGGLDGTESSAGSPDADTWYHVWLIQRSDTGVTDVLFSESASSPTMPTNYDRKRRIGAVRTNASANILAFKQFGDDFFLSSPIQDVAVTNLSTSATNYTITVPSGVSVLAYANAAAFLSGASAKVYVRHPDFTDLTPAASGTPLASIYGSSSNDIAVHQLQCQTNTSSQINAKADAASTNFRWATLGWKDTRGRMS